MPTQLRRPSRVHRASLILTASYVAPDVYSIPAGLPALSFVYAYTLSALGGASGGYARVRPTWTIAGQTARDVSTDTAVVALDEVVIPIRQLALDLPSATCTNAIVIEVPPGATAVSFSVKEQGDAGFPGTFASWIAA